jgi:hypothetical protein
MGCEQPPCRDAECRFDGAASATDAARADVGSTIDGTPLLDGGLPAADTGDSDASSAPDAVFVDGAAPRDAGAGFVLLPTDTIVAFSPQLVAPSLSVVCSRLQVARGAGFIVLPDGAATSITTRSSDASVATPADREDCGGFGALALRAGTTNMDADVVVQGRSFSVRFSLQVLAEPIAVYTDGLPTGTMHAGETRSFVVSGVRPATATAGFLKSSWIRAVSSAPAAEVTPLLGARWQVTARSVGETTVSADYGPPTMRRTYVGAAPLRVVSPGTLTRVDEVLFRASTGDFSAQFALQRGQCTDLAIRGQYRMLSGETYTATETNVTATATGATRVEAGPPLRICADTRGETSIRACVGAVCATRDEFVSAAGARLELSPGTVSATRVDATSSRACVALRGVAVFTDGDRIALPFARLARGVSLSAVTPPYANILHVVESGAPDEYCFRATSPAAEYAFQVQAYSLSGRVPVTVR